MKSLVIAEKPSVARDIARVLGANQKNGGILEGKNYVVTWALGHLVTLADPEEYDRKYEKWEMATLPMLPKEMKLVVIRQTGRQFSIVKTQLFRKDIGEIIIATDAGRRENLWPAGFWKKQAAISQLRDCGFPQSQIKQLKKALPI